MIRGHRLRFGIGHDDLDFYRVQDHSNFSYSPAGVPIPSGSVTDVSSSGPFIRPRRRIVSYALVQDEWRLAPDWAVTAGLRHDRSADFGKTTNPRLALVWDASFDLTAKLLYGQAFRAPAFAEQYSSTNPVSAGNPALRPETIRTLEAAFNLQARSMGAPTGERRAAGWPAAGRSGSPTATDRPPTRGRRCPTT